MTDTAHIPPRRPGPAALAGAAAAGLAIGTNELLAGLVVGAPSLLNAIGRVVIDLQPPGAKELVVGLFGESDKLALTALIMLVAIAIAAVLGVAGQARRAVPMVGFIVAGGAAFVAALQDPLVTPALAMIASLVAVVVGVGALDWLLDRLAPGDPTTAGPPAATPLATPTAMMPDWSRRSFLLRSGAVAGVAIATGAVGRSLLDRQVQDTATAGDLIPPRIDGPPVIPAGGQLDVPGITPIVVPNNDFYRIDTALLVPRVDVSTWKLRVHGLVDHELSLTFDQLVDLPFIEQFVTIACVSNEVGGRLVGNARWRGVPLKQVLRMAGVRPEASQIVGRSVDGWTSGFPTEHALSPDREPMIAVEMNGEPLPAAHGFPARLIVPGLYGYVSATKWLAEIELTTLEAFDAYWIPLGWSKLGPILTQSRIDVPGGSRIPAGPTAVAGVAWAPDRGVARVEVSIDGTWRDATLSKPISAATWVQWKLDWNATPGSHRIQVRATDGRGKVQDESPTPPAPDGARGYHSISVNVG